MLWIVKGNESHEIISCNTFERDGKHQVWIERPNGKTMLLKESDKKEDVEEVKEAIDFAIKENIRVLELN